MSELPLRGDDVKTKNPKVRNLVHLYQYQRIVVENGMF
jgi:hypothetical protein